MVKTLRRPSLMIGLLILAMLAAVTAVTAQPAQADATTFHMRLDTWVDKAAPTTVHGADTALRMNNDANKTKWTYAKVPAGDMTLPAGVTTSKTEIIFRTLESDPTQVISVFAQPNCTWAGGDSLTWSNTGALGAIYPPGGLLAASSPAGTTAGADKIVDVGNYITGNANWCVVLKTSFTNNKQQYRSVRSANGDPALDIRARITYAPSVTTTTEAPTTTVAPTTTTVAPTTTAGPTTTSTPPPPSCTGVDVLPTDVLATKMSQNPAGTTFCLQPGTHRLAASVAPEIGDQLIGDGLGVIVSGAKEVTGWTVAGSDWWAPRSVGAAGAQADSNCNVSGCRNRHDVFLTDAGVVTPLVRVTSLAALAPGKFYEDFTVGRIYVRDNPTGKVAEQAFAPRLISSTAANVRVSNLTLQMAANPAQTGAIEAGGPGWTIDHNDVRFNHGLGIDNEGASGTTNANHVHHQMQMGLGGNGDALLIEGNEVNNNNRDNSYSWLWEAGGSKWAHSDDVVVSGNYFHDDRGPGIWCDINCGHMRIENNYVRDSWSYGIVYEISYGEKVNGDGLLTEIANNQAIGNAFSSTVGFYDGGQIVVSASQDVRVAGNFAYGRDGIGGLQQLRTDDPDPRGGHELRNLLVENNNVTTTGGGWHHMGGIETDWAGGQPMIWDPVSAGGWGNRWLANTYHAVGAPTGNHWGWRNADRSWTYWQGTALQDVAGTYDATLPSVPTPPVLVVGPQP